MSASMQELATLRFVGPRFDDNGIDVELLGELAIYKALVVDVAKEIWRRSHPGRERIQKGFEEFVVFKVYELKQGSVLAPIMKVCLPQGGQHVIVRDDEFDDAADLIDETMAAVDADIALPESFPRHLLAELAKFGARLGSEDAIEIKARRRATSFRYSISTRDRLRARADGTYDDEVDLIGEVRTADLDGCSFKLRLDADRSVKGKFTAAQESVVTDALRDHQTRRLRVRGTGVHSQRDGTLQSLSRVDVVELVDSIHRALDPTAKPIWETIEELGRQVPSEEWARVPRDLSEHHDRYLYGGGSES